MLRGGSRLAIASLAALLFCAPASAQYTSGSSLTGLSGLGANVATFLATPTTANLLAAVTGETGTGAVVFGTAPTISGAILSTAPTLTGFTAGSVLFAGASGVVSQDNDNLFWDDTNNRLGIGTTGGGGLLGKLQVTTDSDTSVSVTSWDNRFFVVGGSGNSGGVSISYNQTSNTGLIKALSPNVAYRNIALNPDGGNVGIGNYIPAVALDVGATSAAMRVRNLFTDASNGEWFGISWSGSVATIGPAANGTGTVRAVTAVGAWAFTAPFTSQGYAIASLPAAVAGDRAHVTNQLTTCAVAGAALTAGGALTCPVFYNGAAWVGG